MSARELIIEHLDLWTGAVTKKSSSGRGSNSKVELTGIKKLRELILELAVRGSLVDQDPGDESAQELLEQCLKAKTASVELGKLKKTRKHSTITSDDIPFDLPQGWVWSRLDDLVRVINGRAYKKHEMLSSGTPLLRVGNLFTSNDWYYSDLELEEDKYIDSGDLIYAWSASFGPFIWDGGRAIYHYHIWKLDLFDGEAVDKRFLYLYLKAITEEIKSSGSGIAMVHMTKAKMEELIVPVPPLEEQHRIVQKVDELMALCDRLEQQTSDQLEAHETLVDTLLGTLTQSENATELADNWARLAAHFDTLFTTEQSIDKLKQTILQLAVMGRLVEQDAGNEPASKLLNRIEKKKAKLINSKAIKRSKPLPPVTIDEASAELPAGWAWTRLGSIAEINPRNVGDDTQEASFIPMPLVTTSYHGEHGDEPRNWGEIKKGYSHFANGDIGLAKITPCFENSKAAVFRNLRNGIGAGTTELHVARPLSSAINPYFLLLFLKSPRFLTEGEKVMTGSAGQKRVPKSYFAETPLALPPEEEQHRIVQKVDELIALCDQLKERLNQASKTRCQLAEAVVENALN